MLGKRRERRDASDIPLEKTIPNFGDEPILSPVLRLLLNLCRRPAIRFGLAKDPSSLRRNPCFASFLAESNRGGHDMDRHDAMLRGRKVMRQIITLLLTGGGAWVVVESARALTMF